MKIRLEKNISLIDALNKFGNVVTCKKNKDLPKNNEFNKYLFLPCWVEETDDCLFLHSLLNKTLPSELEEEIHKLENINN